MGIREIPKSFVYSCDACKAEHVQENANGHYTNSRPKYWSRLTLAQDAYDFQGCAVADGTVERLLCQACSLKVRQAINSAVEQASV